MRDVLTEYKRRGTYSLILNLRKVASIRAGRRGPGRNPRERERGAQWEGCVADCPPLDVIMVGQVRCQDSRRCHLLRSNEVRGPVLNCHRRGTAQLAVERLQPLMWWLGFDIASQLQIDLIRSSSYSYLAILLWYPHPPQTRTRAGERISNCAQVGVGVNIGGQRLKSKERRIALPGGCE